MGKIWPDKMSKLAGKCLLLWALVAPHGKWPPPVFKPKAKLHHPCHWLVPDFTFIRQQYSYTFIPPAASSALRLSKEVSMGRWESSGLLCWDCKKTLEYDFDPHRMSFIVGVSSILDLHITLTLRLVPMRQTPLEKSYSWFRNQKILW